MTGHRLAVGAAFLVTTLVVLSCTTAPLPTAIPATPATFRCASPGTRPITVADSTGLVIGCSTLPLGVEHYGPLTVLNPDSDRSRLRITWGTSSCVDAVSVDFLNRDGGYAAVITEGGAEPTCAGVPIGLGFEVALLAQLDASAVSVTFAEPEPTPFASPVPSASPSAGLIECAPPTIMLIDHTSLVVACEGETDRGVPTGQLSVSTEAQGSLVVTWPVVLDNSCKPIEKACASGQSPEGRVLEPFVTYDAGRVWIAFAIWSLPGSQTCEPGPGVPYTVELSEPLGRRGLGDGARIVESFFIAGAILHAAAQ